MKRVASAFFLSLALVAGLLSPVHSAGTIPFSLSQQLDQFGKPLAGCQFFTIQAGTTSTPQNAFQDSALTLPLPNPITCDAAGRLPQLFLADGTIKVRLTDKNGVNVVTADNIQVIGPSSGGGGGGGTVDPTTILQTGDIKATYGTGVITGFVRLNGRTIGSASSGASERANADTQALFQYLWGADPNLAVSTGRGVSANADWVANKQISLPDWRGRALGALDDMGNSASGRLTVTNFGQVATTLGAGGGNEASTLTSVTQLPSANLSGTASGGPGSVTGGATSGQATNVSPGGGVVTVPAYVNAGANGTTMTIVNGAFSGSATVATGGSSAPFATVGPMMLATFYLKL